MGTRTVFTSEDKKFRITEIQDESFDIENLKGDLFNPDLIKEMGYKGTVHELKCDEIEFIELVYREGVYGYVLERWNPEPGIGWEHVDSCWGFIGQYSETEEKFKHYIVDELKGQIP